MFARLLFPTPIATLLVAATALVFAVGGVRLGFWTVDGPGPGLVPFSAAVLLLLLLIMVFREGVAGEEPFRATPLAAIVIISAYAVVLPYTGFVVPTMALVVIWARLFYRQSWTRAVALGLCLTLVGAALFSMLLKVPLPLAPPWS